jgi:DNA-binding response OmpR family regulator
MSEAKILVADDGRVMRTVITRKLEEKGYAVTAVASGREALDSIEREPVDLLVLDIHMPDMGGLETLHHLRQRYTAIQLPVIMATANDEDEDVIGSFEAGANDFVSKPINFPVLFARMETHLKLKRAMEDLERLANGGK